MSGVEAAGIEAAYESVTNPEIGRLVSGLESPPGFEVI
jgi:hypothetical protein